MLDQNSALGVFLADSAGTRPDTFASKAADRIAAGMVGLFVPSTEGDRPVSHDVFERRIESAQLLLNGLFGGSSVFSSFGFPCRWASVDDGGRVVSERSMLVVSFVPGIAADSIQWSKMLRACDSFRILWRQSVIGVIGPNGYMEV